MSQNRIDTLPAHIGVSRAVPTAMDHKVHGDWWQSQDLEECLHDANKLPRPKTPIGSLLCTAGPRLVTLSRAWQWTTSAGHQTGGQRLRDHVRYRLGLGVCAGFRHVPVTRGVSFTFCRHER
jgi:hypothetical protein